MPGRGGGRAEREQSPALCGCPGAAARALPGRDTGGCPSSTDTPTLAGKAGKGKGRSFPRELTRLCRLSPLRFPRGFWGAAGEKWKSREVGISGVGTRRSGLGVSTGMGPPARPQPLPPAPLPCSPAPARGLPCAPGLPRVPPAPAVPGPFSSSPQHRLRLSS